MPNEDPLAEKAVRLFTFLTKAQQLRQRAVRDVSDYTTAGSVHWLGDLPDHSAIRWGVDSNWDEFPLLSIDRLIAPEPPGVPRSLAPWLSNDGTQPKSRPELIDPTPEEGPDGPERPPEIQLAFDAWIPSWDAWAAKRLETDPVRRAYGDLFKVYVQATQKTEELELVLGTGLLSWAAPGFERVRRHLFTVAVTPILDDNTGRLEFHIDEAAIGLTAEFDMLDPKLLPDPRMIPQIEEAAHEIDLSPLAPDTVGVLGNTAATRLHHQGRWDANATPPPATAHPVVSWAPALILRPRTQRGLVNVLDSITRQISDSGVAPAGILPLIDPDRLPPVTENTTPGALLSVDDEVISPLPLNDVQRRILNQVDTHAQTLVQGPPGTGKTHTAAALLSHLLAQGQRILVTAHTDRALHEVRLKLPEKIRPLAVSVLGASRDDLADLRTAVDTIARRAGEHRSGEPAKRIDETLEKVAQLGAERRALNHQLLDAREADVSNRAHRDYTGTLSSIAQRYRDEAQDHGWIAHLVDFRADSTAPVTDPEAIEWLELLRDHSLVDDADDSLRRRIASSSVPAPQAFADAVRLESNAMDRAANYAGQPNEPSLRALSPQRRHQLRDRLVEARDEIEHVGHTPGDWAPEAHADVLAGGAEVWFGRAEALRKGIDEVEEILTRIPLRARVEILGDQDRLRQLASTMLDFVSGGGVLKTNSDGSVKIGTFTKSVIKECRSVFEETKVNGLPPSTAEAFALIVNYRDASALLHQLDRLWPAHVIIPMEDTPRERVDWHRGQLAQLDRILKLHHVLLTVDKHLQELGVPRPDWTDSASVQALVTGIDTADAFEHMLTTQQPLEQLREQLDAVVEWDDTVGAVRELHEAVRHRDIEAYARAHQRILRLEIVSLKLDRREDLTTRISTAAPNLAGAVQATAGDDGWLTRLSALAAAFRWGSVGAWVLAQEQVDANAIQAKIAVLDQHLRDSAELIAAERAWDHAVGTGRLTQGRKADLRNYSQLVTRLGKGTGKYAPQRRAEIRRAMDRCRPAVPVWIMPIYRVAEQFQVEENMFDVVVVDEASQAGLEATFLQYLAPKIVVIGDDKQVSPAAVGVDEQQLRDLGAQYLSGDRYRATWQDPKRSLFDEAQMRYGGELTLVEHRRCVPEIIGFSNRIAYEPHGINLIPVRQFGAQRLEPFVVSHVAAGVEEGRSGKINRAEARALVDDLKNCLENPAFDGRTMAVISLVGPHQAQHIESLLLDEVPADEWARRDLRVGTAPDFQGSERDVVFLSMVSSREEGQRMATLSAEMYVQRFNVAVSRAKDQVRLFHSIALSDLHNSEDMRHHLLDYAYGIVSHGRELAPTDAMAVVPEDYRVEPFESQFEQAVFNRIVERGFRVLPQVEALGHRVDLVVVGTRARLAVECDGDAWRGRESYEKDLAAQRELERCQWTFFRMRESAFYIDEAAALAPLWELLEEMDIRPINDEQDVLDADLDEPADIDEPMVAAAGDVEESSRVEESEQLVGVGEPERAEAAENTAAKNEEDDGRATTPSVGTILRQAPAPGQAQDPGNSSPGSAPSPDSFRAPLRASASASASAGSMADPEVADGIVLDRYQVFDGVTAPVSTATDDEIIIGLLQIAEAEGPLLGSRLLSAYAVASGGQRVGKLIAKRLNAVVAKAERRGLLLGDDPFRRSGIKFRTFRLPGQPVAILRELGPRRLDEVPPAELALALTGVAQRHPAVGQEQLLRLTLRLFGRAALTTTAREVLEPAIGLMNRSTNPFA
ncbi:AAA domain-containing protein [Granulicoccus sp. GXG6511]|uniref:AAA domain-containing protein n=1 Tax=Granulicoccus sp. GXG6511 TaxID=3381351 RepID=UPI003D7E4F84